jgi:hypothetical protein
VKRQAKAIILLFVAGGLSHIDLFDTKPDAPAEVRGPFKSEFTQGDAIRSSVRVPETA